MTIDIKFKFPDWHGKLKAHEPELMLFQAALIQTNRGMLFDSEGSHNGHTKWAPLKFRNGQILSQRGKLRKSVAPYNSRGHAGPDGIVRFAGDMIAIGTKLLYARMMNNGTVGLPGGVLKPKNAKALKIPLPSGVSANQNARYARMTPTLNAMDNLNERLNKAKARALTSRTRFEKKGDAKAMQRAVNADYRLAKLHEQMSKLAARASKISDTGKGGKGFLFLKSVRIPARPFDQWNEQDQQEMDAALLAKVAEVMND